VIGVRLAAGRITAWCPSDLETIYHPCNGLCMGGEWVYEPPGPPQLLWSSPQSFCPAPTSFLTLCEHHIRYSIVSPFERRCLHHCPYSAIPVANLQQFSLVERLRYQSHQHHEVHHKRSGGRQHVEHGPCPCTDVGVLRGRYHEDQLQDSNDHGVCSGYVPERHPDLHEHSPGYELSLCDCIGRSFAIQHDRHYSDDYGDQD